MAAPLADFPRRVLIEDTRIAAGRHSHLRVTWHPERRQFVFSHWDRDVCLSTVRVPVEDAAEVITLLARGLREATLDRIADDR